jgi:transposase
MEGMFSYTQAAMERTMKVQEVILRAMAKKITWWQAAEIIGISDRQMRRWHERYEEFGFRGLFDRRRGKPSPKKVPLAVVEKVLELYREKYFDLNVRHFHGTFRGALFIWYTQGFSVSQRVLDAPVWRGSFDSPEVLRAVKVQSQQP